MKFKVSFTLLGKLIEIHPEIINSILVVAFLCIIAIIIGKKAEKQDWKTPPTGILRMGEIFVEGVTGLVESIMGKGRRSKAFAPYAGMLILYLATANLLGMIGLTPPTSNYNVTLSLALITFVIIHTMAIKTNGLGSYLKGYFEPFPILFPMNLLGELATPISLSFRLFGNILSGVIIMTLIYNGIEALSGFLIPVIAPVFHVYFDIFSGLLQTFIFTMLSMVFINNAMAEEEEETAQQ